MIDTVRHFSLVAKQTSRSQDVPSGAIDGRPILPQKACVPGRLLLRALIWCWPLMAQDFALCLLVRSLLTPSTTNWKPTPCHVLR